MIPELSKIEESISELKKLTLLSAKSVLTIEDVSNLTGLTVSRIQKLTCYKQIPFFKREGSRRCYFDKTEIEEWLKGVRITTMEEAVQNAAAYELNRNAI